MIRETTDYLLDYFVSSCSFSIIRSRSSACFSSSVALIFTSSFESTSWSDPSGADEELNPGFGPRAKGQGLCTERPRVHWQQLVDADFHSRLVRTSFIQLSCSFILNAKACMADMLQLQSALQNMFKWSVI